MCENVGDGGDCRRRTNGLARRQCRRSFPDFRPVPVSTDHCRPFCFYVDLLSAGSPGRLKSLTGTVRDGTTVLVSRRRHRTPFPTPFPPIPSDIITIFFAMNAAHHHNNNDDRGRGGPRFLCTNSLDTGGAMRFVWLSRHSSFCGLVTKRLRERVGT